MLIRTYKGREISAVTLDDKNNDLNFKCLLAIIDWLNDNPGAMATLFAKAHHVVMYNTDGNVYGVSDLWGNTRKPFDDCALSWWFDDLTK